MQMYEVKAAELGKLINVSNLFHITCNHLIHCDLTILTKGASQNKVHPD